MTKIVSLLVQLAIWTVITLAALAVPTFASPTMFAEGNKLYSWEARLKLVPSLTMDGGVDVATVNAFIRNRLSKRAVSSPLAFYEPICLMNFARAQDVVSSDRETQAAIKSDLEEYPRSFAESYEIGSEKFLLRVGLFENCNSKAEAASESTPFMALVITDGQGAIREFNALEWTFIRIFKRDDGNINLLGCFACGEVQELNYNALEKEFYYKWIGH